MGLFADHNEAFDEILKNPLPNVRQVEQAIVTTALCYPQQCIPLLQFLGLEVSDLYDTVHQDILGAMYSLHDRGADVNAVTIAEHLKTLGRLIQVGGVSGIVEVTKCMPLVTDKSIGDYVAQIHRKAHLRELIKVTDMIRYDAMDPGSVAEDVLTRAESEVLRVVSESLRGHNKRSRDKKFVRISEDMDEFRKGLIDLHHGKSAALPTGIRGLDSKLEGGGLQPQAVYMVAAEPKAGKTALVLGIAKRVATTYVKDGQQRSVGIISMEMRRRAIQMRLYSEYTHIPFSRMSMRGFTGIDYDIAIKSIDPFFKTTPLYITDAIFSLDEMWRECERLVMGEAQAGLIAIDYIQLASIRKAMGQSVEHRTREVSQISREIKHMGQQFNIPFIAISSLNRAGELRESGELEYDCEALIHLQNPEFNPRLSDAEKAALNKKPIWDINAYVKYNRNGPTGDTPLKFLREYMSFLDPEEYESYLRHPNQTHVDPVEQDAWLLSAEDI
jgi:replicative DNA helicase